MKVVGICVLLALAVLASSEGGLDPVDAAIRAAAVDSKAAPSNAPHRKRRLMNSSQNGL